MKTLLFILLAFNLSAQHIGVENAMLGLPIEKPVVKENLTTQYDSCKYVRVNEFLELKQQLHDKKEDYKRLIMIEVLAKFCTFMSPEKAAKEAVKYAEALIKELENEKQ